MNAKTILAAFLLATAGATTCSADGGSFQWNKGAEGNWNDPEKWRVLSGTGEFPQSADDVAHMFLSPAVIDLDDGSYTINEFNFGADNMNVELKNGSLTAAKVTFKNGISLKLSDATFDSNVDFNAGNYTLELTGNSTFIPSVYHYGLGVGTLNVHDGDVTIKKIWLRSCADGVPCVYAFDTANVTVTDEISLEHGSAKITLSGSTITTPKVTLGNGRESFDVVFNLTLAKGETPITTDALVINEATSKNSNNPDPFSFNVDARALDALGTYPLIKATKTTKSTTKEIVFTVQAPDEMLGTVVCDATGVNLVLELDPDWTGPHKIHVGDAGIVTKEPTCEEPGELTHHCVKCGIALTSDEIPALGHDCEWTVVANPTETAEGKEQNVCRRCGKSDGSREIPQLPSDRTPDAAATTYTWNAAGGNVAWAAVNDWTASASPSFGYPDSINYAVAKFDDDTTVDLGGDEFAANKITLAGGKALTVRNGTLKLKDHNLMLTAGARLTLDGVDFKSEKQAVNSSFLVANNNAGTLEMVNDATMDCPIQFNAWGAGADSHVIVRDGASSIKSMTYNTSTPDNFVSVANGSLSVEELASGGDASKLQLSVDNGAFAATALNIATKKFADFRMSVKPGASLKKTPGIAFGGAVDFNQLTKWNLVIDATQADCGTYKVLSAANLTDAWLEGAKDKITLDFVASKTREAQLFVKDGELVLKIRNLSGFQILVR